MERRVGGELACKRDLPVPSPNAVRLSPPRAMFGKGTPAGRSSQQKYNELMKSWHRAIAGCSSSWA